MKRLFLRLPPGWVVAAILAVIAVSLGLVIHAPFRLPSPAALVIIGFEYLIPFVVIAVWILLPLPFLIIRGEFAGAALRAIGQAGYAFCLGVVMLLAFHIKLWVPLINPRTYDALYEAIDRDCFSWLNPLFAWRGQLHSDLVDHLYFNLFVLLFVCSFIVHYFRTEIEFRRVFLASILVQALGGISYLIAPALGPFIFHPGFNAHVTSVEHELLTIHQALVAGGPAWLQDNTSLQLAAGLGAMPSLHVAAAYVFLYYAQKYCKWLACLYWPIFIWIVFEAMASRWHYGIDLLMGYFLGYGCVFLADRWIDAQEAVKSARLLTQAGSFSHVTILPGPAGID